MAELRRQLADLSAKGRATAPGSPEQEAALTEWGEKLGQVLALADELEG
ncbi:hypothetical protein [Cyanobium sp. PCC 7001]|nr:hypothetical protein [Cyanobium sp. PCC 7001]